MRRTWKRTLGAGLLAMALCLALLPTAALAADGDVEYVKYTWDANSNTLTSTTGTLAEGGYTPVESNTTTWSASWYVVQGDVDIESRVTVSGDVHLILTDGCELTVAGITVNSGNSLTIYGQNAGSGKLISEATRNLDGSGIGGKANLQVPGGENNSGAITIHGGDITATGNWGAGIGGGMWSGNSETISIYNGTVKAEGHGGAAIGSGNMATCGDIYIYGGNVQATSDTESLPGIGSGKNTSGNIHIYGGTVTATNESDYGIDVGDMSGTTADLITGEKGRAVIFTNGIRAANFDPGEDSNPQTGVIFIGREGKVYADESSDYTVTPGRKRREYHNRKRHNHLSHRRLRCHRRHRGLGLQLLQRRPDGEHHHPPDHLPPHGGG